MKQRKSFFRLSSDVQEASEFILLMIVQRHGAEGISSAKLRLELNEILQKIRELNPEFFFYLGPGDYTIPDDIFPAYYHWGVLDWDEPSGKYAVTPEGEKWLETQLKPASHTIGVRQKELKQVFLP